MATCEDHLELIVCELILKARPRLLLFLTLDLVKPLLDLGLLVSKRRPTSEHVESLILGYLNEPGARVLGNAGEGPLSQGLEERFLNDVLGQIQVRRPQDPGECRDHRPGAMPEQVINELLDVGHWMT